jgi:hypothetical protein
VVDLAGLEMGFFAGGGTGGLPPSLVFRFLSRISFPVYQSVRQC